MLVVIANLSAVCGSADSEVANKVWIFMSCQLSFVRDEVGRFAYPWWSDVPSAGTFFFFVSTLWVTHIKWVSGGALSDKHFNVLHLSAFFYEI